MSLEASKPLRTPKAAAAPLVCGYFCAWIPSEISVSDLDAALDSEPRILDVRLAQALGLARPTNIRRLIDANRAELERYGAVCTRGVQTTRKGGRPAIAYHLNEPQALLLCMFCRTDAAADVRQEVITVFMAYRRAQSQAPALPTPAASPCAGCAFLEFREHLSTPVGQAIADHLDGWLLEEHTKPPTKAEMDLITERRKERRELIEQIRCELASRLSGQ